MQAVGLDHEVARWRNSSQFLPLALCLCDSQWHIVEANTQADALLRYNRQIVESRTHVWQLCPVDVRELVEIELPRREAEARQSGEENWTVKVRQEFPVSEGNGTELHVSRLDWAGCGKSGEPVWQVAIRSSLEPASDQAFNFHFQLTQSITEQAVDPIFVVDGKGKVVFTNPEAERVFGWSREELIGRSLHDTLHHEHSDGAAYPRETCPLVLAQASGKTVRALELVFFHRDGSPVPVSCSNSPLLFENDEVGAVLIVRDVSRQRSMERALSESEERLRVAVAAAQMGTWDLNLLSGAVTLDDNCRKALNFGQDGHHFMTSWLRAVHPEDRTLAKKQIEAALDPSGDGQFHLECRTLRRTEGHGRGGTCYVQAQGQAFFENTGAVRRAVRLIGTIQDVTDRKRDEDALRRANDDLQQFAYAAAHDLQEPLRNVVNLLGLYKRNLSSPLGEDNRDLINASIDDARRMHQMVRDLLSFTNIHGSFEQAYMPADANSILKDVTGNLATLILESKAKILSDRLPGVKIRSTHLLQLLQNLISNSLKYRRLDTALQIRISARRRGGDWLFAIADNGIGFDPVYAQKIFGVFKRLHGRAEYPGSGIGLAICARIVHTYSGKIWAEGNPGEGATFYFTLPAVTSL